MPTLHYIILGLCAHSVAGLIAANRPASFIPESGLVCFEGPEDDISKAIAFFRGGPLAKFSPYSGIHRDTTCASLNFSKAGQFQDSCWPTLRKHFKPDADPMATVTQMRDMNLKLINDYADSHDMDREFALKWTACFGGCGGGNLPGYRWWGADRGYTEAECKTVGTESRDRLAQGKRIGSFRTDNGAICWQGPFEYMKAALERTKRTPYLHAFHNATVEEITCGKLGYDVVRDPRDECWPEASKNMRSATEAKDMGEFVVGPYSLKNSAKWYEYYHKLDEHTALDWITCDACEVGGANRDRGMMFTLNGCEYTDRYAGNFCSNIHLAVMSKLHGLQEVPPLPENLLEGKA